jgi:hypothetical protein
LIQITRNIGKNRWDSPNEPQFCVQAGFFNGFSYQKFKAFSYQNAAHVLLVFLLPACVSLAENDEQLIAGR